MISAAKEVTILLVEDDAGHARLIERNLQAAHLNNRIVHLTDGRQALDYLFGEGEYAGRELAGPLLVLLDLDLPVVDGYEVLARMKADKRTRRIPVIVLTAADDPQAMARCYHLGCNAYLTKPVDQEKFSEVIGKVGLFLSVVTIPTGE